MHQFSGRPISPLRSFLFCAVVPMALGCSLPPASAADKAQIRFIDSLPVVEVQLGDVKADFLLDTGGQIGITVPRPLINGATKIWLKDDFQKAGDAAGHTFSVQKLTASSVSVGGAQLGPVDGLVHYKWGLSIGEKAAPEVTEKGAIGLKALAAKNLLLDVPNESLTLFDRGAKDVPNLTGWQKAPFEYDARGLVVNFTVNGMTAAMALDSAATGSVVRKDATLFTKTRSPCKQGTQEAFCGLVTLHSVQASGAHFGSLPVAVVEMGGVPFDGILGIDFLRSRQVYVDFETRLIYVHDAGPLGESRQKL